MLCIAKFLDGYIENVCLFIYSSPLVDLSQSSIVSVW